MLFANCLKAKFIYGYEFYGAISSMIITHQAEKAFVLISQIMHYKSGTNVWGDYSCGKTELVKDLSR